MTIFNSIEVELEDAQGRRTRHQIVCDAATDTVAEAQTAFSAWVVAYSAAGGGGIKKAQVTFPLTLTPSSPDPDSNIDENAWLDITVTDGGSPAFRFPMPKKTDGVFNWIVGGAVDKDNAELGDYVDLYKAAGAFTTGKNSARDVATLNGGYLEKK